MMETVIRAQVPAAITTMQLWVVIEATWQNVSFGD